MISKHIKIDAYKMDGCGIVVFPTIRIEFSYSMPEITLYWWSFVINIHIYKRLSDKFMDFYKKIAYFDFS